jgi:uncharacterized protein YhjY with autotransporter beta-barrel domain
LDAEGNLMGALDPENAVLFNLDATAIGLGSRLPDGLFGAGGQEGDIGFFSEDRAGLALTRAEDTLAFGALSNGFYLATFGNAFVDNSMVPDGLFWDDNNDPSDESALIAWNNLAGGGWTYGTLETTEAIDGRLAELAAELGVEVADLAYAPDEMVPDAIVAAAKANGLFAVDPVEDLRNANLNYDITIGEIDGGEFTLRWTPAFAPIVNAAQSELQFKLAGYLDAAAEIPYWDLGNATAYQAAIVDILDQSEAAQATAITRTGFNIAPAFSSLGFETAREHVSALTNIAPPTVGGDDIATQMGGAQSWLMGNGVYGLASVGSTVASYDATASSVGYDVTSLSFMAGLEARPFTNTAVGFAIGGATSTAEAAQDLGEIDAAGLSVTAFTRSQFANGASLHALLGYQDLSYETSRSVMGTTADGSTDGSQVFGAVSLDYQRDFGALKIGPKASFAYYDISVDGFAETGAGAFNLAVSDMSDSVSVASIGVTGAYLLSARAQDSRLTGGLSYTQVSGDDLVVQSGFIGLPGLSFTSDGMDEELIEVNFGFETVLVTDAAREISLGAGYGGAFGEDYERHGVQLGLNVRF